MKGWLTVLALLAGLGSLFSSAQENQQKSPFDRYVAVWHLADRVLVERWGMELDTGDSCRMFFCLQHQRIQLAESVTWSIPVESESAANPSWGYEQRWKIGLEGKYEIVLHRL
ncbi:MAG TPA: hypothetical protein VGG56_09525 [Terracidiphilus sp.]|jgi:hypothetical protein